MADVFQSILQNGRIGVGFLGAAQIDRWANINTTVIGNYERPKIQLPGSGGAAEIATHARRTLVIAKLNRRAFPESVDFVTLPGHVYRGVRRQKPSLPGSGPIKVITDRGVLEPNPESGELTRTALYPGVMVGDVAQNIGWPLRCREPLGTVAPPTPFDLQLLRHRLDPERLFLKANR